MKKKVNNTKQTKSEISKNSKTAIISSLYKKNVFNFEYKTVGSILLKEEFWKIPLNRKLVHEVILSQQASWRINTKKTKGRGEVSGGGKKPWKQKGTGRARHGSIRSPIWVGGGVTFGPSGKENYSKKVNRKVFSQALKMILADCLRSNKILFWNDVDFVKPSTKKMTEILKVIELENQKILFIIDEQKHNFILSLRNLVKLKAIQDIDINPYDLLYFDKILILDKLLPNIEKRFI